MYFLIFTKLIEIICVYVQFAAGEVHPFLIDLKGHLYNMFINNQFLLYLF